MGLILGYFGSLRGHWGGSWVSKRGPEGGGGGWGGSTVPLYSIVSPSGSLIRHKT